MFPSFPSPPRGPKARLLSPEEPRFKKPLVMLQLSDIVRLVSAVRIMGSQHFIGRNPPKNTNSQKFDENIKKNLSMSKKGLQYSLRDVHNSICAKGVRSQAKKEWAKSWEKIFFQKNKYIYIIHCRVQECSGFIVYKWEDIGWRSFMFLCSA